LASAAQPRFAEEAAHPNPVLRRLSLARPVPVLDT
jgi:hypothetical protein